MEDVTELARTALLEVTPESTVGQQVGTVDEGDGVVSVLFANRMPGYPGWRWTVSVAQVEGDEPTVLEVELMPGDGSLVAPEWVPWADRMAEYRAGQGDDDEADDDEGDDDDDLDEDADEEADYEDPDDDEADDDASDDDDDDADDDDDDEFDDDEDDLGESDDDELDGVDVDAAAEQDDAEQDDAEQDDADAADEETVPTRSRGARRRASRVRPTDPDEDLEVDRLDPGETDPERHGA